MPTKYYIYELVRKDIPCNYEFCGYIIYDKTNNQLLSFVQAPTRREAHDRCAQIVNISSQYDNDMVIWRNWPIIMEGDEYSDEKIIEKIKEREV